MKQAETACAQTGISALRLMENAGSAAARHLRRTMTLLCARVTVVCGRGNNGGDGFVVARRLLDACAWVTVILACGDPSTPDAAEMLERLAWLNLTLLRYDTEEQECLSAIRRGDLVIDAVFGTGFHGELKQPVKELFAAINEGRGTVVALDMPSGSNADTGFSAAGCVQARQTIAFASPKTGHFAQPASEFCGRIVVVNIGIPDSAFPQGNYCELTERRAVENALPVRRKNSNKGTFGRAVCLCGSRSFSGAAYLAASGAARCGAGLVSLLVPQSLWPALTVKCSEVMVTPLAETQAGSLSHAGLDEILTRCEKASAVLIGCGLSQNEETFELVRALLARLSGPVILDADGLNAAAGHINLLRDSGAQLVLTPHPGEMARLAGLTVEQVQADRVNLARRFACENGVTLVLKGANTVAASSDGQIHINPTGNPGMAKGGSGDILAGMITGLCAQGIAPAEAAVCGVYLHGLAGDRCAEKLSQYGMLPTDMLTEIPQIFRELSR